MTPQKPATPPPETARPQRLSLEIAPRTLMTLLLLLVGLWTLSRLMPVLLVLLAALVIVGTVNPGVRWLEARGVRRGLGIALVFSGLLAVALGFLTLTIPAFTDQAKTLLEQEPALHSSLVRWLRGSSLTRPLGELVRKLQLSDLIRMAAISAFDYSTRILMVLAYFASSIFLALYIMIDRDRMRGGLFLVIPRCHHIRLSRVLLNLESIVGGYLRGQIITSAFMAAFTFFLLLACGIPNALAIAIFAGAADVLPYLGAFLSVGAVAAAAYTSGPVILITVTGLMLLYEEFESRFILPKVYGRELRLPSPVILLSLLTGGVLMGVTGALLALPLAAAGMMLIEELRVELPGQQAQAEDVERMERDQINEDEYERRAEGLSAEMASQIALEISVDRQKEENTMPVKPDTPGVDGKHDPGS